MPLPVHPARLAARPGHRHDIARWSGVAFMPHATPGRTERAFPTPGSGADVPFPNLNALSECPLPELRHTGRRRMGMTPPTGCVAQREHGETSDRRDCPDTGQGMASADAAWPHRSPPIGNHQPHILAALRPSGLQRRMCPWISFSPELGLAGQPTLGDPLFFAHSVGRLTVTVLPLTPGKSANSASIMAGICGATAADSLRVTSVDS